MSHLITKNRDPILDLEPWVGQRQATFRFDLSDGVTGQKLGQLTPLREANLSHDTQRTIKRSLSLSLGVVDTAAINPITDRVSVFMVFPSGAEYPLGRYMFTDASRQVFTSGIASAHTAGGLATVTMGDEMFLVDQQITKGITSVNNSISSTIQTVLEDVGVDFEMEASPFLGAESWAIGTNRGSILEALALTGDYFSPWFGNDYKLHFIRSFDPSSRVPDFDLDDGNNVLRDSIVETDDLITAPNRFVVISNASNNPDLEIVATADVPPNAPHSIPNRGFIVPSVISLQVTDSTQAQAVATGLANRQTVFERVTLTTAPDPRYDSYDVVRWQEQNWLELAWSMQLVEGGTMTHLLRKSYAP